jgi:hypothetical protein
MNHERLAMGIQDWFVNENPGMYVIGYCLLKSRHNFVRTRANARSQSRAKKALSRASLASSQPAKNPTGFFSFIIIYVATICLNCFIQTDLNVYDTENEKLLNRGRGKSQQQQTA